MPVIMSKIFTLPSSSLRGTLASDLEVGSSVYLNVNGVGTEFLIVHQGLPSSIYDNSCNGTYLLMKDCYESRVWDSSSSFNDYGNSDISEYLNSSFFEALDKNAQSNIKQVKIPYRAGNNTSTTISSGSNGLSTKVFLLSAYEVGVTSITGATVPADGACLSYFSGAANAKRIAYLNGTASKWWLRTPYVGSTGMAFAILESGSMADGNFWTNTTSSGIRPAFILPSNAVFDPTTKEFLGVGGGNSGGGGSTEPEDTTCTITVTGSSVSNSCYAIINGSTITAPCTIEVNKGTVIQVYGQLGTIIDGVRETDGQLINYIINKDTTVLLDSYAVQVYAT